MAAISARRPPVTATCRPGGAATAITALGRADLCPCSGLASTWPSRCATCGRWPGLRARGSRRSILPFGESLGTATSGLCAELPAHHTLKCDVRTVECCGLGLRPAFCVTPIPSRLCPTDAYGADTEVGRDEFGQAPLRGVRAIGSIYEDVSSSASILVLSRPKRPSELASAPWVWDGEWELGSDSGLSGRKAAAGRRGQHPNCAAAIENLKSDWLASCAQRSSFAVGGPLLTDLITCDSVAHETADERTHECSDDPMSATVISKRRSEVTLCETVA
jgi:hypothetical protein